MSQYNKIEQQFIELLRERPDIVFKALSIREISKPLIVRDRLQKGLSYGALAIKYGVSKRGAKLIVDRKLKKDDTNNSNEPS